MIRILSSSDSYNNMLSALFFSMLCENHALQQILSIAEIIQSLFHLVVMTDCASMETIRYSVLALANLAEAALQRRGAHDRAVRAPATVALPSKLCELHTSTRYQEISFFVSAHRQRSWESESFMLKRNWSKTLSCKPSGPRASRPHRQRLSTSSCKASLRRSNAVHHSLKLPCWWPFKQILRRFHTAKAAFPCALTANVALALELGVNSTC